MTIKHPTPWKFVKLSDNEYRVERVNTKDVILSVEENALVVAAPEEMEEMVRAVNDIAMIREVLDSPRGGKVERCNAIIDAPVGLGRLPQ